MLFDLQASYKPAGDQPEAIKQTLASFKKDNATTLMWATGTGKTFTMANVIQDLQKPTLIISHNKTLAAQLATEFKHFFPKNAVHYFVSYFDYYQPESYLPEQWLFIEKEATINQDIQMYRLATMASLLDRKDVIVVALASSLYGLGQQEFFRDYSMRLEVGKEYDFSHLKKQLLKMQYKPMQSSIEAGMFDIKGETIDIYMSTEKIIYRLHFNEEELEMIERKDATSFQNMWTAKTVTVRPATQYIQDMQNIDVILEQMQAEMELRHKEFTDAGLLVEAERIKKRVSYDIRMIRETWFVNGIENYSLYFDDRLPGEPPNTIFDYFPDDMLLIIDESHMTIPQLNAMPKADASRKTNLIKHGFRLPSAIDHRPLRFEELEVTLWLRQKDDMITDQAAAYLKDNANQTHMQILKQHDKTIEARAQNHIDTIKEKHKPAAKTLFVSATPATYELELSSKVVEQIIRPTWLLDPLTYIYPKSWDYNTLLDSIDKLQAKKPHVTTYLESYKHHGKQDIEDIFG